MPRGEIIHQTNHVTEVAMKKLLCFLAAVLLLGTAALAQVDTAPLAMRTDMLCYTENGVDMVYRSTAQPFFGVAEDEQSEVCAYIDFVDLPNEGVLALRLTLSIATAGGLNASALEITEGGKTYAFPVSRVVSEYDMMYYEDYPLYLTDESLALVKAMARSRSDEHVFTLLGEEGLRCTVTIPGDIAAEIYDLYVDLGGTRQDFTALRDLWPVRIGK